MSKRAVDSPGLVVPVDVVAFLVGSTDPQRTASFAGATVNYNLFLNSDAAALLGGNVTRGFQDTMDALEPGIHLHWALPDALTRATGPAAEFPAAPNRWLLTRIVIDGETLTPTSFIIEGDSLSATPTQAGALVVPVQPSKTPEGEGDEPVAFAYLGQAAPLDSYDPARAGARALAGETGFELTAVSNGVPSFAAYYPEGRNSFGFYDPIGDLPDSAILTYVVTGWYQSPDKDPAQIVHGAKGAKRTLAETHDWLCAGDETYTLYSGSVQHVGWSANQPYVPENPTPIAADAALGNTPSEALAAWFANSLGLDGDGVPELLLTAFQQGLWDRLSQPATPMLPQLREALHDSQFRKIDSGPIYSLHQTIDGQDVEAIDLPIGIAQALDSVNSAAAALLEAGNQVDGLRWQMFADWYRYFSSAGDPDGPAEQSAIFNHFGQVLMPIWDGGLNQACQQAQDALTAALETLDGLLDARKDLSRRKEPGPRYFRPNDPALLLRDASGDLDKPRRYGGDNSFHPAGKLLARPTGSLVSAVKVGATERTAADFAAVTTLPAGKLPYAADCSALLAEALLLDADVAQNWSGQDWTTLESALVQLLAGQDGSPWTIVQGTAPSPVAVNIWTANPWLPIFLTWDVGFAPLQPTLSGSTLTDYDPHFFTANFTVDPTAGSFLSYTPSGPYGISVDPKQADYSQGYVQGWAVLSAKPADNFHKQIDEYLKTQHDPTLEQIRAALDSSSFLVQPIAGLTDRMLNRDALMQVSVVVTPNMDTNGQLITNATIEVLSTGEGPVTYHVTPTFGDPFNPIRAGWMSFAPTNLGLIAVDAFGQRRPVTLGTTYSAASMAAQPPGGGTAEPGFAYAAPRLAQASRLLFQWLSAADNATTEYNDSPAENPICGWLLPNHLTGGFFFYDSSGRPIGALFPAGDDVRGDERIVWQGAPGNDRDIDTGLVGDPVVAAAHPMLRDLILQIGLASSVTDFQAFYAAVDAAHGSINPGNLATDAGLTVLVGRPVALVQAALTLDLQGPLFLDQNRACLNMQDPENPSWTDSDAGVSGVQFPVVLGDLDNLDDGLVGYFVGDPKGGYQLGTFFSDAAPPSAKGAVVQPTQQTLPLTPTPASDTSPAATPLRVLMLVDPRAPVHAVTGLLPTQSLLVPPYLASAAMSTLEISIEVAPVLRASGGLAMPTPSEPGFELALLEQLGAPGRKLWYTVPEIAPAVANAMWSYTPQSLTEGWLRFNPALIAASLTNGQGQPLATGGQVQAMTLTIANRKRTPVSFSAAEPVPEGTPADGSIFYVHFGTLVAQDDVAAIDLAADGWTFTPESDPVYGPYFAATRSAPLTLGPSGGGGGFPDHFDIALTGLKAATGIALAHVFVDYYDLDGVSDGVATATVTVTQPAAAPRAETVP